MLGFRVLRAGLATGSLIMILTGIVIALQPKSVPVKEVKQGVDSLVESGRFTMQPSHKPVVPGMLLLWGGLGGLGLSVFVNEPEIQEKEPISRQLAQNQFHRSASTAVQPAPPVVECSTLSEFWAQGVKFSDLAKQLDLKTRLNLLDKTVTAHEHGWIERLLCCPCLLVIGRPGSAKSSFAAALAICRELLVDGLQSTIVVDPNAHLKVNTRTWQPHWELNGSQDDWIGVGDAIQVMYKRFADSQGANYVSSIYDELTAYEGNVDSTRLGGFLPQITSKARASEEYITLVSHNDTLSCLGGKTGQAKLKDDMVQLNLGSKSIKRGKFKPTGKGCIEGLDFDDKSQPVDQSVTLPRWFDPAILIELFPEVYQQEFEGEKGVLYGEELEDSGEVRDSAALPKPLPNYQDSYRDITDGGNSLTSHAARVVAAKHIAKQIVRDLSITVEVSRILTAIESINSGTSKTHVVKVDLGFVGDNFAKGKYIYQLIVDFINNEE